MALSPQHHNTQYKAAPLIPIPTSLEVTTDAVGVVN